MPSLAAARKLDHIGHTSLLAMIGKVGAGLVVGAVVGAAMTVAASAIVAATVGTGGLAGVVAVALVSSVLMHVTGAGGFIAAATNAISSFIDDLIPPEICGHINQGSPNVFTNRRPAARAVAEGDDNQVLCYKHPPNPFPYVAEGSDTVFINGYPAHRKTERSTCDAKTAEGSHNVFMGGQSIQTREITSEMPAWLEKAGLILGVALALCTRNWKSIPGKLACLGMGMAVGYAADTVVSSAFGSPVHAATGAKLLDGQDDTDFALAAPLVLLWKRRYSSLDLRDGWFGPGWSVPVSVQLKVYQAGEHPNIFIDEQGREVAFDAVAPGASLWNSAEGYRLAVTPGGHYVIETEDGLLHDFGPASDQSPKTLALQSIEDYNGNGLHLHYGEDGRLDRITDGAGRFYQFDYHPLHTARIAAIQVTLPQESEAETLVQYGYDELGRLVEVTDALGQCVRRFTWHRDGPGAGLMASHTLPTGMTCHYEWAAYADHPRVVGHRNDEGESWQATYDLAAGQTAVTDQQGRRQAWCWNARFAITAYTDALGHTWQMQWNEHGLLERCTQPNGGIWRHTYDDQLRLIELQAPDGTSRKTAWHSEYPLPLSEVDELGQTTAYEYDDRHNLVAVTDPMGRTETSFDQRGRPVLERDAKGGLRHWVWNAAGQLLRRIDCSGRVTSYGHDRWGYLSSVTDALGNTTRVTRDALGREQELVRPDGTREQWEWNPAGQPLRHTDALGAQTRYGWGGRGQLLQRTDALGYSEQYRYDAAGNLSELINANGQRYRFHYDALDRLVAQEGLDGLRTEYTLDSLGYPIAVRQGANLPQPIDTHLERDLLGRLCCRRHGSSITRIAWDAGGRPTQLIRSRMQAPVPGLPDNERWQDQIDWSYNAFGQVTRERVQAQLPEGWSAERYDSCLEHDYDALGNRLSTRLPGGHQIQYLYYGSGHLHQIRVDGEVLSDFERDALHREIERSQGKLIARTDYDALGRRTAYRSQSGRLPETRSSPLSKRYAYDANGELISRQDGLIGEQRFDYDALGQIRHQTGPGGTQEQFRYDPAGNLRNSLHARGLIDHDRITVFEDKRYRYDAWGRLVEKLSGKQESARAERLELAYNDEHQLIESRRSGMQHSQRAGYHYDALGRRIAKKDDFGVTLFRWDGMRLAQEIRRHRTATYIYEQEGYEPLARLDTPDAQVDWIPQKPAQIYHFHTHINGAPEEMTDAQGQVAWQGRYAAWGNLALESYPLEAPDPKGLGLQLLPQNLRLQGQYADTESGLHYNTFRYYDPDIGRFTTPDPIGLAGGVNLYRFAPNASSWIDPWGWAVDDVRYPPRADISAQTGARSTAIDRAWVQEKSLVKEGGGTRNWTPSERELIKNTPNSQLTSVMSNAGYTGHHINSVEGNGALGQKWQGDPRNIRFLKNHRHPSGTNEHVHANQGHRGNTANATRGRLIDRVAMTKNAKRMSRGCL